VLPASSVSLGVERRRNTGKSRFIRPDKARRVGRCVDFDELRNCEWKDRIARPPSQFSLVSANHKFDAGLDYTKDALNDQLPGKTLWSCELVSFFIGIIAKKTRSDRDLISHVPLIDYNRSRSGRNAAKNGITKKQLQEHSEGRHRELRHLASDIYQFDHVYGFGLVDNHFFAIALTMKEKKIHIVVSIPTDEKREGPKGKSMVQGHFANLDQLLNHYLNSQVGGSAGATAGKWTVEVSSEVSH